MASLWGKAGELGRSVLGRERDPEKSVWPERGHATDPNPVDSVSRAPPEALLPTVLLTPPPLPVCCPYLGKNLISPRSQGPSLGQRARHPGLLEILTPRAGIRGIR
ncbi:unnamed protein product [Rangifer tarandus platyrhynchus]|uniref:Uncharacterized protein n=1 Tax=Rangifer tarandus platyrhynchus TaxID=3082113 RepID=A0ABN8ZM36_RANTA|nr:unnamed protein product [Rangifer tarandus platyrhynchus]